MNDVVLEKKTGGGTTVVYPVGYADAWEIARSVFQWEIGEPIEFHRDAGYLLTSTENLWGCGTVMGAWLEEADAGQSKVTVVTKRRCQWAMTTSLTERTFHVRFAQGVAIVQSGESLPKEAPRGYGPIKTKNQEREPL